MRKLVYLVVALTGCVHATTHFYPASPAEAVEGQPEVATAEAAGVRLTVHAGDWRGAPEDIEDRATPVEVYVENESGHAVAIGPERFSLLAQNGFLYRALDSGAVHRLFAQLRRPVAVYYGLYDAYPWPGFWRPYPYGFYPYTGFDVWGPPVYVEEGPPAPPPQPHGVLNSGGYVSVLLFFPVPAPSLATLELVMDVVDDKGARLGTVRVPMTREPPTGAPAARPAAPAQPPPGAPPPPQGTPPAPEGPPPPPPGRSP